MIHEQTRKKLRRLSQLTTMQGMISLDTQTVIVYRRECRHGSGLRDRRFHCPTRHSCKCQCGSHREVATGVSEAAQEECRFSELANADQWQRMSQQNDCEKREQAHAKCTQ